MVQQSPPGGQLHGSGDLWEGGDEYGEEIDPYAISRSMTVSVVKRDMGGDSLGWLVELIEKFLQFQPKVQQKFFSCQRFKI